MIDPSPNTEIVLTSDSFHDDPAIESLSPAALAVLNSYMAGYGWLDGPTKMDCHGVAAALRAAADYDPPDNPEAAYDMGWYAGMEFIKSIANELEAQ
jgi:hypothetical protein